MRGEKEKRESEKVREGLLYNTGGGQGVGVLSSGGARKEKEPEWVVWIMPVLREIKN